MRTGYKVILKRQFYKLAERFSTDSGNLYPVCSKSAIFTAERRPYLKECFENSKFNNGMRSNLDDCSDEEAGLAGKWKIIKLHNRRASSV